MVPFPPNFYFAEIRVKMGKNDDFSLENQNSGDPPPAPMSGIGQPAGPKNPAWPNVSSLQVWSS